MRKLTRLPGVILVSAALVFTAPAMAQTVDEPANTNATTMGDDDDDDSGKWGWLGLLGLLGLYGLKRRDDRHTTTTHVNR